MAKQEATFGFKKKEEFNLDDVKRVIEKSPKYKVTGVVSGPTDPQKK